MPTATIIAAVITGSIGLGLFVYGSKQRRWPQLGTGLLLSAFPYFIDSALLIYAGTAALLGAMWYAVRHDW